MNTPLVFHDSAEVHRRASMTVRLGEGDTVTLKKDAIQLARRTYLMSAICLFVRLSGHLSACLSHFPAVWPRQQISSKCGNWQAVADSWEHTHCSSDTCLHSQISVRINGNDTQSALTFFYRLLPAIWYPRYPMMSIIAKPCRHLVSVNLKSVASTSVKTYICHCYGYRLYQPS